jgi:alpha-methylacyl-CoA racemase
MMYTLKAMGQWTQERGSNLLDGGAHFYDTYQCKDGKWLSIGAIEPQFYALLLEKAGITDHDFSAQWDRGQWPLLKEKLAAVIATRPRDDWCALFDGTDACVAPVLDMDEAPMHPHNKSRQTFIKVAGVTQPAPAPRFSGTPTGQPMPPQPGGDAQVLTDWGFSAAEQATLRGLGVL